VQRTIYVCGSHATELGPSREHGQEARIISAESEQNDTPIKAKVRSRFHKAAVTKSNGSVLPKSRVIKAEPEQNDSSIQSEVRSQIAEGRVTKSNGPHHRKRRVN